jgi:hypothetical protein
MMVAGPAWPLSQPVQQTHNKPTGTSDNNILPPFLPAATEAIQTINTYQLGGNCNTRRVSH